MSFPLSPTNGQQATLNGIVYSYSTSTSAWTRINGSTLTYTAINLTSTTASTGTNTGALIVAGGLGVGGNGYFGGNIYMGGALVATTATATTVPKISSIQITSSTYVATSATAVSNTGGYIVLNGSGFVSSAQVIIGTKSATSIGFVNANQLQVQVPAQTNGTYIVYVTNPDGGVAINVPGLTYNDFPVWSSGSTLAQQVQGNAISLQLAATDSTGTVTYSLASGSSLPPGLSLSSSGLLSGTVTGLSVTTVYNFTINAVDIYTQATAQAFTITISVGDTYWPYTTLLLHGDGTNGANNTSTFIDSSSYNNTVTRVGSTATQGTVNPFGTLWSWFASSTNYNDTNYAYVSGSNTGLAIGTSDFTCEFWFNLTTLVTGSELVDFRDGSNTGFAVYLNSSGLQYYDSAINPVLLSLASFVYGSWYHLAISRTSGTIKIFLNGSQVYSGTDTTSFTTATNRPAFGCYGPSPANGPLNGYISNFRLVIGNGLYASNFTPSTTPLTAVANTKLLLFQSNRLVDNSGNNYPIAVTTAITYSASNVSNAVTRFSPFNGITSYSTSTYGGSAYFSGIPGDYLTVPITTFNASTSSAWTVEAFAYHTTCLLYTSPSPRD